MSKVEYNLLDAFATDLDLEKEGVWVMMMKGAEFKLRPFPNTDYTMLVEKLKNKKKISRKDGIDPDVLQDIALSAFAKEVIVDWRGDAIVDPANKKPMKYTYSNCAKLIKDPSLKHLTTELMRAAAEQETFKKIEEDELEKNLESSFDGNTTGSK